MVRVENQWTRGKGDSLCWVGTIFRLLLVACLYPSALELRRQEMLMLSTTCMRKSRPSTIGSPELL